MRLVLIREDNAVIVNGTRHTVDCNDLPEDVHAVQWNEDHGEVEYRATRCTHCGARSKKGNVTIYDVSPYAKHVEAWGAAQVAAREEARARAAEVEAEAVRVKAAEVEAGAHTNAAGQ